MEDYKFVREISALSGFWRHSLLIASIEHVTITKDAPIFRRDVVQETLSIGRAIYALFEDDNLKTNTFWVGIPLATMQRDLVGLSQLAGTVLASDFLNPTLLARMSYGIVGIRSFARSIRLQSNCRIALIDKTLQVGISRMR